MSLPKFLTSNFEKTVLVYRLDEYIISDIKQNGFILNENSWELFDKQLLFKLSSLVMLICGLCDICNVYSDFLVSFNFNYKIRIRDFWLYLSKSESILGTC